MTAYTMSVKQAADQLGMGVKGVLALIESGELPPYTNQGLTALTNQRNQLNKKCWLVGDARASLQLTFT